MNANKFNDLTNNIGLDLKNGNIDEKKFKDKNIWSSKPRFPPRFYIIDFDSFVNINSL